MAGERLDVFLAEQLGVTRSRAEKLIRAGNVRVDGIVQTKPGLKLTEDARVEADMPPPVEMDAQAEEIPLEICYEDNDIAVVNKPCGMVVHPAAGNESGTMVNALLFHLSDLSGIGGTLRPGIVHRLDKDTSGLLLVAKNDAAHLALSEALKNREMHKTYRAVVYGGFREESGVIEKPIARHPNDRKRMAVVEGGRYARTEYSVSQRLRGATLLDVGLITGRTHQIRVHFASIGHPLLGDPIYGGKKPPITSPRLMLHAWRIEFTHPSTGESMRFEAEEPAAFREMVKKLSL